MWISRNDYLQLQTQLTEAKTRAQVEEARRDRAELEADRLRVDVQRLIGLLAQRQTQQPTPNRDPFAEQPTPLGMEEWLTPQQGEVVMSDEVLQRIEVQRGEDPA